MSAQEQLILSIMFIIVAIALLLSPDAKSETLIHTGGVGYHIIDRGYNNQHNLVAIEQDNYIGGYFKNSFSRDTFFGGKVWDSDHKNYRAFLIGGAMQGYDPCPIKLIDNICALGAAGITFHTEYPVDPTFIILGGSISASITYEF